MPILAFQINSGDTTSVHLVDLPAFVIGHNATSAEINNFPEQHTPGVDLNGDGDYSDLGETLALPARSPATFFGDFFSFAPPGIKERIVDFDQPSVAEADLVLERRLEGLEHALEAAVRQHPLEPGGYPPCQGFALG